MNTATTRLFSLALFIITMGTHLSAGTFNTTSVRIANQTDEVVYCAFYYQQLDTLTRNGEPVILPGNNAVTLFLPATRLFSSRMLAVSDSADMPQTVSKKNHSFSFTPATIGLLAPDDFTVHYNRNTHKPTLTDTRQWEEECQHAEQYHSYAHSSAYAEHAATVTSERPEDEKQFIADRLAHVHAAQQEIIGKTLSRPLRIGICSSGGGFRAMLATLGLLAGLDELGLLSSVLTFAGLSGSTWAILSWLASSTSLSQYTDDITTRLHRGLMHHLSEQYHDLATIKKQKKVCGLPMSAVDLYGIGLSHTLIKPIRSDHTTLRLPDVATWLTPETHPFVVCTAATRYTPEHPYTWLTFSPFSICQLPHGLSIPVWAFGRTFWQGESLNNTPPPLLGYAMGMFGSSFSISIRDALERAPESLQNIANMLLPSNWYEQLTQATWANAKLTAAYLPNFTYGLEAVDNHTQEWLCVVDGGYLNNIPLQPLLAQHEEPLDLVIMMDSKREHDQRIDTVRAAYASCAAQGYQLAPLTDDEVLHNTVTLSHGEPGDTSMLYINLEPDSTFDETFNATRDRRYITPNLFYTPEASKQLLSFVRHVVTSRAELFRGALTSCAEAASALS